MPLILLLALVTGGIGAIALIVHMTGGSRRRVFASPAEACSAWDREMPDLAARGAELSADGSVALIDLGAGQGLVWSLGADCVARRLTDRTGIHPHGQGLRIAFHDPALADVIVPLRDTSDPSDWRALLRPAPQRPMS